MSLLKKISKAIDASINEFTLLIGEKYGLDQADLLNTWKDVMSAKTKKSKKTKSAFQVFAAEYRIVLKEENPHMTFGQLSTEISKKWKLMSDVDKAAYGSDPKDKNEVHIIHSDHGSDNKSKSKAELLELAASMGLKNLKKKNKNEILEAIAEAEEAVHSDHGSIESPSPDNKSKSKAELLELAASMGLKNLKKKNKNEIMEAIAEAEEAAEEAAAEYGSEAEEAVTEYGSEAEEAAAEYGSVEASPINTMIEEEEEDQLEKYKAMKTDDLKMLCKEKGLKYSGNKEELIRRLLHN